MKYLSLIWSNLKRKKLRTLFTFLSVVIAFLLFGLLSALRGAFSAGVDLAGADRLVTLHKVSIIQLLPESYLQQIRSIEGVELVGHGTWLGGYFKEPKNFVAAYPVIPEYIEMYPEFIIDPQQWQNYLGNRTGALVGDVVATKYGWEVGDRVPMRSSIWRQADGSDTWEVTIEAIYTVEDNKGDRTAFMFHYDYFDESRAMAEGQVGWYVIQVNDPDRAAEIAGEVDALFENSPAETKTATEKVFATEFASQVGNIGAIVIAVLGAVFFTMLLVTANTMGQAFRERTNEIGVLKTLGFTNGQVMGMMLAEAWVITLVGGAFGLGLAWLMVKGGADALAQFLPAVTIGRDDMIGGALLVLLLGLLAGLLPAVQAMRLKIVDALRRV